MSRVQFPIEYPEGTMLIKYPDDIKFFTEVEAVDGTVYAEYSGELVLTPAVDLDYKPLIKLTEFTVKSNGVDMDKKGNIYWTAVNTPFDIISSVTDGSDVIKSINESQGNSVDSPVSFIVMLERVVKQGDASLTTVGDIRLAASVTATSMSISSTSGFNISGNYVVTAERLNSGLKEIGAPFRIEMDKLEFDALNG